MQRVGIRQYSGNAGETVTVTTQVKGSGAVKFRLNGKDQAASSSFEFQLQGNPGNTTELSIALFGEVGSTCDVSIRTVDGGADSDVLLSTQHNPFPVHPYKFVIAGL